MMHVKDIIIHGIHHPSIDRLILLLIDLVKQLPLYTTTFVRPLFLLLVLVVIVDFARFTAKTCCHLRVTLSSVNL
jgi:hypothetical protein